MKASLRNMLAGVATLGLVGTGAALYSSPSTAHAGPAPAVTMKAPPSLATDGSIADVAERVVDSVVNISVSHEDKGGPADFDPFFTDPSSPFFGMDPGPRKQMAKGSGVIVTASGRILTNAHVVDGFDDIKVTLQDGSEHDAKVIGKDTKADLAVIQLKDNVAGLKPVAFGDSSTMRLGDVVLAVGDGMGVGKSVSMGIVSAKGRGGIGIEEYEDFIQTDAAINPGNSGGALVNMRGELIGINTAIASRSGGYQGIGFAIPSNMARPIMEMLVKDGKVTRGYLGVGITTVTPSVAKELKLGATSGVAVQEIQPDGPAAKARLREGDVIVSYNGSAMRSGDTLKNVIAMTRPGSTVELQVVHRDGSKDTLKATLGRLDDQAKVAGKGKLPKGFQTPDGWQCQQTDHGIECQQSRAFGRRP